MDETKVKFGKEEAKGSKVKRREVIHRQKEDIEQKHIILREFMARGGARLCHTPVCGKNRGTRN